MVGLGPTASGASSLLSRLRALSRTIILNYIYKIQSFLALAHSPTAERPKSQRHVWILWQYGSNGKRSIASGAWPSCVAFRSSISAYSYYRPPNPFIRHSSNHWHLDDPLAKAPSSIPRETTSSKPIRSIRRIRCSAACQRIRILPNPHRMVLKEHGNLHPHGNENWEQPQAATKFCGRNVILPARSTREHCRPPPLLSTIRGKQLCRIWPSPAAKPGRTPPFSLLVSSDSECAIWCACFQLFDFVACCPPSLIPHLQLILFDSDHLSPPAMHYLILRSHYPQVFWMWLSPASLSPNLGWLLCTITCSWWQRPTTD